MNIETINKLMNSGNIDDVLIGLEFIKEWTFHEIKGKLEIPRKHMDAVRWLTSLPKENLCLKTKYTWIHINSGFVHMYDHPTPHIEYTEL